MANDVQPGIKPPDKSVPIQANLALRDFFYAIFTLTRFANLDLPRFTRFFYAIFLQKNIYKNNCIYNISKSLNQYCTSSVR